MGGLSIEGLAQTLLNFASFLIEGLAQTLLNIARQPLLNIASFLINYRPERRNTWKVKGTLRLPARELRIADLHAHYAMHRLPDLYKDPRTLLGFALDPGSPPALQEGATAVELLAYEAAGTVQRSGFTRMRAVLVALANVLMNKEAWARDPAVTLERMEEGGIGILFSPVTDFFDEAVDAAPSSPPDQAYFETIINHLNFVEHKLDEEQTNIHPKWTRVITCRHDLDCAIEEGQIAFIHAIEGGFHLGTADSDGDPANLSYETLDENIRTLKQRGVAYVTLAHLIPRGMADNAPGVPFITDDAYNAYFRAQRGGLEPLGRAAVEALMRHRILVDVTHMGTKSIDDVFKTRASLEAQIPVIATHMACRMQGNREYNLSRDDINRIAESGGILGIIFCDHWMREAPEVTGDTFDIVAEHLLMIREVTGSYQSAAIGSDLDGFIKPALDKLRHLGRMKKLRIFLHEDYPEKHRQRFPEPAEPFTDNDAQAICSGNVLRVLEHVWPSKTGS